MRLFFAMKRFWWLMLAMGVFTVVAVVAVIIYQDSRQKVYNLTISNITDTAVTISWQSDKKMEGKLLFKEKNQGSWPVLFSSFSGTKANDDRSDQKNRYTHHITLRNLKPETEYSIRLPGIINAKDINLNNVKTEKIVESLQTPDPAYGRVEGADNRDSIVVVKLPKNDQQSEKILTTTLAENGTYTFDMGYFGRNAKVDQLQVIVRNENLSIDNLRYLKTKYKPLDTIKITKNSSSASALFDSKLINQAAAQADTQACGAYNLNNPKTIEDLNSEWSCGGFTETNSETKQTFMKTWCDGKARWLYEAGQNLKTTCQGALASSLRPQSATNVTGTAQPQTTAQVEPTTIVQEQPVSQGSTNNGGNSGSSGKRNWQDQVCQIVGNKPVNTTMAAKFGDSLCVSGECITVGSLQKLGINEVVDMQLAGATIYTRKDFQEFQKRSYSTTPAYAIVMFGTNDAIDFNNLSDKNLKWESDYKAFLNEIKAEGTVPVLSKIPVVTNPDKYPQPEGEAAVRDYVNGIIQEIANEEGYLVREVDNVITAGDLEDGVHITPGHFEKLNTRTADLFAQVKQEILKCNSPLTENIYLSAGSSSSSLKNNLLNQTHAQSTENSQLVINEDGDYQFFKGSETVLDKEIIVHGGQAIVKAYEDTNGNGIKDANEQFVADITQFRLNKTASILTYGLSAGWNAVHIPLVQETNKELTADNLIANWNEQGVNVVHVAKFENGKFITYSKRKDADTDFADDFKIFPGQGLFVFTTNRGSATLKGSLPSESIPLSLNTGWNLIGVFAPNQSLTSEILMNKINASGAKADTLSQFENGLYKSVVVDDGLLYGNNYKILSQRAYFLRVENPGSSQFIP